MRHGPQEFWEALADTDWAGRFESFSKDELRRLRLFASLNQGLTAEEYSQQPLKFQVKVGPDENYQRLEHAGRTQMRSMTMVFRQLWMSGEDAEFGAVRGLLRQRLRATERGQYAELLLDELGKRYKAATREVMMREVWADDPMGEPKKLIRAHRVIDDWLYGGAFHTDPDKEKRNQEWSPTGYEFTLLKAVHGITEVMRELDIVVAGVLGTEPAVVEAA